MIELLRSPWENAFVSLLREVTSSLVISSPYVGRRPCEMIAATTTPNADLTFLLLTDLSRDTILSGATDVTAIYALANRFRKLEVRFLPSIHAKAYVADDKLAIVTSGNLTDGGLSRNFELGVKLTDRQLVAQVRDDIVAYAALGTRVERDRLRLFSHLCSELSDITAQTARSVRRTLRREFECRMRRFEDEIIRSRAAGRTLHAIFEEAILHLLSREPMTTETIHSGIQQIHPDLCDDVDRVIDGKHFGKKWKHAVRTAEQHLKKRGLIELREGLWRLTGERHV